VLFSTSNHFGGPVEDRDEGGVEAGTAAYGAALEEKKKKRGLKVWGWPSICALCEALAEALWSCQGRGIRGIVSSE
jgi:hypothetical protein